MQLKDYQQRALDQLEFFLEQCRSGDFPKAYRETIARAKQEDVNDSAHVYAKSAYAPVDGMETRTPYCCIRLPTGGGKTILAAHAIKTASAYMEKSRVPVLWLVPSTTIQSQTVDALKQERHPYRQAIKDAFDGNVAIYDIGERRQIRPSDLKDKTVVIVATYAAFRVEDKYDRKVYKTDEAFEPHFTLATPGMDLDIETEGDFKGQIAQSFVNVMHMHRPLLILDEAHNFMTSLSGDVKERLNPAAIIEFTATPKPGSNVISAATAEELKLEQMIKMPIHLQQHASAEQAIAHAVQNRARLHEIAEKAGEKIRPITLYQAQPKSAGNEWTVDHVKKHLIENEKIPEAAIVIATGEERGLDGIDLFREDSKIEHIITQQALREGWDCSYAYVFCSLASLSSSGAVEQILGRVLRMPFAERRTSEELNRAYAHVSEGSFFAAAQGLQDRLVKMGFDEAEARKAIQEMPEELGMDGGDMGPLYPMPKSPEFTLRERPNTADWTPAAQQAVRMVEAEGGEVKVTISNDTDIEVQREIAKSVEEIAPGSIEAVERFIVQRQEALSPAERGESFALPQLHLVEDGQPELVFPEMFIDLAGWNLLDHPAELPDFNLTETPDGYEFDIEGDKVDYSLLTEQIELALDDRTDWDEAALSRFLDRTTRQIHTGQEIYLEWCRKLVKHLVKDRRFDLAALVRGKYVLRRAVTQKVLEIRESVGLKGVQMMIDGLDGFVAPKDRLFRFEPGQYHPPRFYSGGFKPKKHFYARIGDLGKGEELSCAQAIDGLAEVKHWVRNLVRTPNSYWLPTATDRFYPDFVAELNDGRHFVIEHKGQQSEDSDEKDNIGRKLEEVSEGRVLFLMTWGMDVRDQLKAKLES